MKETLTIVSYNVRGIRDVKKRQGIFNYVRNHDVVFLQETHCHFKQEEYRWSKEWGGLSLWSRGSSNSKGVTILFNKNKHFNIIESICDPNGRYISCKVKLDENVYNLVNVYAPNQEYERVTFFNGLNQILYEEDDTVLGGDFNCVLDNDVDRYNCRDNIDVGQIDLRYMMNIFDLEDVWRRRNPFSKSYSWEGRGKKSRIDFFLTSVSLDSMVENIEYVPAPFSDHKLVALRLRSSNISHEKGLWKMNVSVVKTKLFQKAFKIMWNDWKQQKPNFNDKNMWWDIGKKRIKEVAISVSKIIASESNREMHTLENRLKFLNDRDIQSSELNSVKDELRKLHEKRGEGSKIRSRIKWWEEGERSTRYFHNLEKRQGKDKLWSEMVGENGQMVYGTKDIQNKQVEFYKNLYTSEKAEDISLEYDYFLNDLDRKLSLESKVSLDSEITMKELTKALSLMKNNKSPGPDGIAVEFYKIYWNDVKSDYFEIVLNSQIKESLPYTQYLAVITLLYKKGKREDIRNWRPISLLNVDFKILSKLLAERLKKVLPDIIHTDQRGCIAGRYVGENIRLIEDVIGAKDDESLVLLIDQEKAFDRVEWKWLFKVLEAFNFGRTFISWIHTLYNQAKTSILTNGVQSAYFGISRGIRQGDAMSALLFIIQIEPLAEKIRKTSELKGIDIITNDTQSEVRIAQYVDDTSIFLHDKDYLAPCLEIIHKYENVSGSKLNKTKTKALLTKATVDGESFDGIEFINGPEKVLGVAISNSDDCSGYWNQIIKKLKSTLTIWSGRDLSFEGKIHIIKSIGISTIMYAIEMKHIEEPYIKEINKLLWNFLWSGKKYMVKREICCLPKSLGGLGMININLLIKVKRIKLVIRILSGDVNNSWNKLPISYLKCLDRDFCLDYFALRATDCKELIEKKNIPQIYKECILSFEEFCRRGKIVQDGDDEILWCNNKLKFYGKPLTFKHWAKSGIIYLSDILEDHNLSERKILQKLKHRASFFFDFYRLRLGLLEEWKQRNITITNGEYESVRTILNYNFQVPGVGQRKLKDLTSKEIYSILLLTDYDESQNSSKQYWSTRLGIYIDWELYFEVNFVNKLLPRNVKDFNWKVFYGQVNTESRLQRMNLSDGICKICQSDRENLEHMFVFCKEIEEIWKGITTVILFVEKDFVMNTSVQLCGYLGDNYHQKFINVILSLTRFEIWKRRNMYRFENVYCTANDTIRKVKIKVKNHCEVLLKSERLDIQLKNLLRGMLDNRNFY